MSCGKLSFRMELRVSELLDGWLWYNGDEEGVCGKVPRAHESCHVVSREWTATVTASYDITSWVKLIMKSRNYEDLNTYIVQGVTSGSMLELATLHCLLYMFCESFRLDLRYGSANKLEEEGERVLLRYRLASLYSGIALRPLALVQNQAT
ncbi:hypothetical protein CBL_13648 [Carabus blaptoides fortunei]